MIDELDELLKYKQETTISFICSKNNIEFLNVLLKKYSFNEFCDLEEIIFAYNEYVINDNKRIDILIQV